LRSGLSWLVAAIAAVAVVVIGVVIARVWSAIGTSEISAAGWLAMGLGVVVTLALGVGLMALVFISNRRGYDEIAGNEC
jgi:dipeptide/tripeptide permease